MELFNIIYEKFPELQPMLNDVSVLEIDKLMKHPYPALIGVIVGQKITYRKAKEIRKFIYQKMEIAQKEFGDHVDGTMFSAKHVKHMKNDLCKLENWNIIERVNAFLNTKPSDYLDIDNPNIKENILSLESIKGIGPWTTQSTILCSLVSKSYISSDIFPINDKFLQNSLIRLNNINLSLFGKKIDKISLKEVKEISDKWSPYRGIITWYFWRWF